ncbi:MAG: hypothetical protein K0S45_1090, partial [Nitrospira sp.]|nr:hypothetical protein [Nitrospira sp.]
MVLESWCEALFAIDEMSDESQDTTLVRHLSMRFFSLSTA